MSLFCRTQRKIFWRKFVTGCFEVPLTSTVGKKNYGSQWCPRTALFPTFFRISSFVFSRTKTLIQVWKYLIVSKWQNYHFWVDYPFKDRFIWSVIQRYVPVAQWLEHCVSSAKVVGSIPREHTYWQHKRIAWMHCKSLWIKASAKCINVNVTNNNRSGERNKDKYEIHFKFRF